MAAAPGAVLRHLPFFEALGAAEEGSAEWRAVSAGLTTLRLVDHWLAEGADATRANRWAVHAVRRAVSVVDADDAARQLLGGIVELVDEASQADVDLLAPRLLAYAHVLDLARTSRWRPTCWRRSWRWWTSSVIPMSPSMRACDSGSACA